MLDKSMSRSEIDEELRGKGDFVQIDYLSRFLEQRPPTHKKKLAFAKLLEIYESKKMFNDSAKVYDSLAILATSKQERIDYLVRGIKSYIQGENFEEADSILRNAMGEATIIKKEEIYDSIKNFYKKQAEIYEKESKRNHSVKIYERMLGMRMSDEERREIKEKLLELYEKLGKFRESSILKRE